MKQLLRVTSEKRLQFHKKIDKKHFNIALNGKFVNLSDSTYNEFVTAFRGVLNKHSPIKVKTLRAKNNSFMTKT